MPLGLFQGAAKPGLGAFICHLLILSLLEKEAETFKQMRIPSPQKEQI